MARKREPERSEQGLRNTALSDALQTQDVAAVAFALRHGPVVVPLTGTDPHDGPLVAEDVWTFRDPSSGEIALVLFSDESHKPAALPTSVSLQSPDWLRAFLGVNQDQIATVLFDLAGPHPMRSTPADLIAALDA
ncbi:dehydrogenase [Microbacterium pumilum]|uniref:Dehydrogenase n=1 Tax=Microbacterium pumilum TaxID=344165 RepID=A0ABN2S3B2_9MICO